MGLFLDFLFSSIDLCVCFLASIMPFFLFVCFLNGCTGFLLCRLSLAAVSRDYSLVAVHWLLIVVASLVVEHGLQVHRLQ